MTNSQDLSGVGAMLLRVALGIMWIAHASLKFLVFGIAGFAGWLESQGLPSIFAWPVPLMEVILGLAMVLGIYSRYAAILLIPILLVATTVHLGNGWVFSNEGGGWEYPVFLFVAMLAHILIGDGSHALRRSHLPIDGMSAA